MILLIAGGFLCAAGILAGATLVAAPFGWLPFAPNLVTWVLFPLFFGLGFTLMSIGARDVQAARRLSFILSGLALALSKLAALGLLLSGIGLTAVPGTLGALWYVFVVAGVCGVLGVAAEARTAPRVERSAARSSR